MIQLHNDYLNIKTSTGETIPCSAELVTLELVGDSLSSMHPDLIRQVAAAILHYFKHDLGRETVSIADFSSALQRVLMALGFEVRTEEGGSAEPRDPCSLSELANGAGESFELGFFPHLRDQVRRQLDDWPHVLRFYGLRSCVKKLLGAKRWSSRCQELNDQIVEYLRQCLRTEGRDITCGLVVK